jgi:exopolyphosphatase / guanosine-5'-triphosphate,3'-diphosphate pyrophosphatase
MESNTEKRVVRRIAAIDLGTNSFHAVIVDIFSDGSFYTIDRLKEMVLLAEKGIGDKLSKQAMDRGIDALKRISTLCEHQHVEEILAFATSAIREAENGGEFIQRAIDEIGIKINAISGKLEAELISYAVRHGISMDDNPVMMVDIGGGSVEFIIGDREKTYFLSSLKIGVARMSAQFVNQDPISTEEIHSLHKFYQNQLTKIAQAFAQHRTTTVIGSSGTMQNIALMIAHMKNESPGLIINELRFTDRDFFRLYQKVIPMRRDERLRLNGLDEKRVDIIAPGLVLVDYLIKKFGIREFRISEQALREGIVLRYIRKELPDLKILMNDVEPRRRSIFELLRKTDWHEEHSKHVAKIALILFDHFREQLNLPVEDRELLEFAAYMHDIGYYISHRKHHKHAQYLIRNADLKGFKEIEIEMMANIARYHRRSTPKSRHTYYNRLPDDVKNRIRKLSGIIRVADGLDRSHYQNVLEVEIDENDDRIELRLTSQEEPQLEIWGAKRKSELFEEVTGKKIEYKSVEILQAVGM